jgi:hypothetical protein
MTTWDGTPSHALVDSLTTRYLRHYCVSTIVRETGLE